MDSDPELQRALHLSLLEEEARKNKKKAKHVEVIEILDSDEDVPEATTLKRHPAPNFDQDPDSAFEADLSLAIRASQLEYEKNHTSAHNSSGCSSSAYPALSERAKMEQERVARLKRLRPDLTREHEAEKETSPESSYEEVDTPQLKRHKSNKATASNTAAIAQVASYIAVEDQLFLDGEIRQTANVYAIPSRDTKPTFRLAQIVAPKSEIQFIIFSSYCTDTEWLSRILPESIPIIHISQPETPDGRESVKNTLPGWVKTSPKLRGGRGCMHMKFMLMFFRTGRLRILVTTANFIDYDWKAIENTAWVQDFPLSPSPPVSQSTDLNGSPFAIHLRSVLVSLNVPAALRSVALDLEHSTTSLQLPLQTVDDLPKRWDWTRVTIKLVASIAGRWEGWAEIERFGGHLALSKAIRDLGVDCPDSKELALECQGSSIGAYSAIWLNEFYVSARGASATRWLDFRRRTSASKMLIAPDKIKILFPSLKTVDDSVLGRPGGGTMFCRQAQWTGKNFPRHLLHDSNSKRGGILMHTKMIIATFTDRSSAHPRNRTHLIATSKTPPGSSDNEDCIEPKVAGSSSSTSISENKAGGWVYMGSHNFTPSAWGNLSGDSVKPIMNVTNYELGILFPLPYTDTEKVASDMASWQRPPRKYTASTDTPWMQDLYRQH